MKPRNLSSTDRQAILRRAIIRAEPEYYAWSPAQQEQYRLSIPEGRKFLIRQSVLRSLFGLDVDTEEAMREALEGFDDAGSERIRSLIPHRYVAGSDHGKREKGGSLWDMRVEAGGMEPQLDELQRRYYEYLGDCHSRLLERFDDQGARRVYIQRTEQGVERNIEFAFSDQRALDAVRCRRFWADCQRIAGDSSELAALIDEEEQAAFRFLEEQFRDIQKNFDPSVVPFRKKRRIIVADGALDDLS